MHVFLDTETTGFGHMATPPREDAIIEIGVAYRLNGSIVKWGSICNPGERYFINGRASEALKVNRISIDDILQAPDSFTVSERLKSMLNDLDEVVLHAYNIPFDRGFLDMKPWLLSRLFRWGEDVMDLSFRYFKLPVGYRIGLARTLERLGIMPDGTPHRADTDAVSALMAYEKIKNGGN